MAGDRIAKPAPLALALGLWLAACHSVPGGLVPCHAPLRAVAELGVDRSLRASVRIERGERVAQLELSIEKHQNELVMLARNELGAIAFVLVQRGDVAEIERSLPPSLLPLPPLALLADVQQVFFGSKPQRSGRTSRCGYRADFAQSEEGPH